MVRNCVEMCASVVGIYNMCVGRCVTMYEMSGDVWS